MRGCCYKKVALAGNHGSGHTWVVLPCAALHNGLEQGGHKEAVGVILLALQGTGAEWAR